MAFKEKYTITTKYLPKPSRRRSGLPIGKVRFLVAHDTGNPGSSASGNVNYYINSAKTESASAHIFVDDKQIIECIPALTAPPEKAWHVLYGKPKDNQLYGANANDAAIGVEYCYGRGIDSDKAYDKYVWVLAKLCYAFKLDPSKDIAGHFFLDPERKTDPVTGLAHSRRTYDQLLKDVVDEYNECASEITIREKPFAIVQESGKRMVTTRLNLRAAPNTRKTALEVIPPGTELEYGAKTLEGQPVNNNATWYRTSEGYWFWDGGTIPHA